MSLSPVFSNDIAIILERLRDRYDPQKIFLFGSAASGTTHSESDLDFLIVKDTGEPFTQRSRNLVLKCFPDSPYHSAVDFVIYTPEEFKQAQQKGRLFIEQVLEKGKLIYEAAGLSN